MAFHVSTERPPYATLGGEAVKMEISGSALATVIAVHAPQLLFSLDSVITPELLIELLSAQTLTYHVPYEVNAYEREAVAVLFAASEEDCADVPITVALVPEESSAIWKRFVKPPPVEAVPLFVIVDERVTAVPTIAVVGVTKLAVRSGAGGVTVTVAVAVFVVPPAPVQVRVYVYVVVVVVVRTAVDPLPFRGPPSPRDTVGEILQLVALAEVHVMVEWLPETMGLVAERVAVGVGGGIAANAAVTVQAPVIAPVVYVVPESEPLQPVTEDMV